MDFEYKLMLIAKDASEEGYKEGFEKGYKEGFEEGFEKGYREGFEESYKEGFEEGYEEERREVRLSNYSSLVQDGILSLSEAMKRSDLSEEEINGWIQAHSNT